MKGFPIYYKHILRTYIYIHIHVEVFSQVALNMTAKGL